MSEREAAAANRGAYGLRFSGLPEAGLLVPVPPDVGWPEVRVSFATAGPEQDGEGIGAQHAAITLLGGEQLRVDRRASGATLYGARSDDGSIIHPYLTSVATVFGWWHGREVLHGGAFTCEGRTLGLLGGRESGKSSLLAALAIAGQAVLSDDLLVLDGRSSFAGPRCVDLRPGVSERLGLAGSTLPVRGGERERLTHAAERLQAELAGYVFLEWGTDLELTRLDPGDRLERLAAQRCVPTDGQGGLLPLVELPAWELRRPRRWSSLEPTIERLLDLQP
jgi:hypothetical protein